MRDIILYLIMASLGYFLGSRLRNNNDSFNFVSLMQTASTGFILFVMSARIGSNREVIENIGSIGLYAFLTTIVILFTTIAALFLMRKALSFDKYGKTKASSDYKQSPSKDSAAATFKPDGITILILIVVIVGIISGHLLVPKLFNNYDTFTSIASTTIRIGLCILLLFVGIDMGMEGTAIASFKKTGLKVLFFPVAMVVGTLIGGMVSSIFLPVTLKESLAISAGFGWYSMAPAIIMDSGHITASAISFIHNVMRELISVIMIPFVAKGIGYLEAAGFPGSPAMDICIPIYERATNSDMVVYSFICGSLASIVVPILVPLFLSL